MYKSEQWGVGHPSVSNSSVNIEKKRLRNELLSRFEKSFGPEFRQNPFDFTKLGLDSIFKGGDSYWAAYRSFKNEFSVDGIIKKFSEIQWAYPRVEGEELSFYLPYSKDDFELSRFGILEPVPSRSQKIDIEQLSGALVPGVAFDQNGGRLGRGKGYYDRALKNFEGVKIGVGFHWQFLSEKLPMESHDIAMDYFMSEQSIQKLNGESKINLK